MWEKIQLNVSRWLRSFLKINFVKEIEIKLNPNLKGKVGEFRVDLLLHELSQESYVVFNDILLKNGEKFSQIDHVIVSKYGVFVIETKNYRGEIVGKEEDFKWNQHFSRSHYEFYSPIKQNETHIEVLKELFEGDIHEKNIPFISIILFSEEANISKVQTKTVVIHENNLLSEIYKYKEKKISGRTMWYVIDCLRKNNVNNAENRAKHIEQINQVKKKY